MVNIDGPRAFIALTYLSGPGIVNDCQQYYLCNHEHEVRFLVRHRSESSTICDSSSSQLSFPRLELRAETRSLDADSLMFPLRGNSAQWTSPQELLRLSHAWA